MTKEVSSGAVGSKLIQEVAKRVTIPFTVMGGINLQNIDEVLKKGARRIAVVTAITQAEDISEAVRELRSRIQRKSSFAN